MAGHSQFKNIMHRKAGQDAKRGKIFTKLIREISTAARQSGPDPDANPRLRVAIDKALDNNMTKDTIQRAIKRGSGESDGEQMVEIRYEGYGPHGVAVIVDCLTDNKNRTVGEVRHAFTKSGGNLGTSGSVAYLFQQKGMISFPPGSDENKIMEVALDAGAEDIIHNEDDSIDVLTENENFQAVRTALNGAGLDTPYAEITWFASTKTALNDQQNEEILKLTDMLEDLDDVQQVYTNAN
ncbi:MAG: YebC/PmpR family DNA-binding transcriptional regulator [Proteobacteria bacterium]|nr:YebC/PmpR family DNA-binding transcriptional regulator [Pseudomonadota bacterium]